MNQPSEQLTACYNIVQDKDQPLSPNTQKKYIQAILGEDCKIEKILGKNVLLFQSFEHSIILLCKCITYLGNPHPIFKKRIQIPRDWVNFAQIAEKQNYDVRFIGIYHYDNFIIFADFKKDTYLKHKCNNSAAHVYINDLYQGATSGIFTKIDKNGNEISCIASHCLKDYLNGQKSQNTLLEMFAKFNCNYNFGEWITALEAISEMHNKHWSKWKETEWAGWFLEYKFSEFSKKPEFSKIVQYSASSFKAHRQGEYDFDLWFPQEQFFGDLKASDISQKEAPGNDCKTFINCLNQYGKFWYIVYEHQTQKDSDHKFEATKWRNHFVWDNEEKHKKIFNEMSYSSRMKHSVKFVKMFIIELN